MLQTCRISHKPFLISDADLLFYDRISPVINGKKYAVPVPTLCPEERLRRRWAFRNEHTLYNNKCSKTGKPIVAMFPPTLPITIYEQSLWWDKSWNGTEYGREFEWGRSFFEQFATLLRAIPHPNLLNAIANSENSDYVNCTISLKNCYMVTDAGTSEDCYYSNVINTSKNCLDCTSVVGSELGYELIGSLTCYNCQFVLNSDNCRDSSFLYDCKSCSDCFGCFNLRHKQYCWYNEQLSKEEYQKRRASVDLGQYSVYQRCKADFLTWIKQAPREYAFLMGSENCTGNVLVRSHNTKYSFDSDSNQDSAFTICTTNMRDSYDIEHSYNAELCLEVMAATNIYQNLFCFYPINSQSVLYSYLISGSNNCFGCAGLKDQQYCILNRQYSKEEYERLVPLIIEQMIAQKEWGEFFPMHVSLHGYNESLALNYFPLSRDAAKAMGANWSEYEAPKPALTDTLTEADLPDSIRDVSDAILDKAIVCSTSGKPFRIIKQELEFYRQHNLPLPRTCHVVRLQERVNLRLPRKLWPGSCDCEQTNHHHQGQCQNQFETPYQPGRPEKIYCKTCFEQTVA